MCLRHQGAARGLDECAQCYLGKYSLQRRKQLFGAIYRGRCYGFVQSIKPGISRALSIVRTGSLIARILLYDHVDGVIVVIDLLKLTSALIQHLLSAGGRVLLELGGDKRSVSLKLLILTLAH